MRFVQIISLMFFVLFGSFTQGKLEMSAPAAFAADNMAQVQLILKKLRGSLVSMKDFDELEAAGMDQADVDLMRKAMKRKIKQMTGNAVELIKAL